MSVRDDFTSLRISAATGAEREWRAHIARSSVRPAPTGRHSRLQGYGSQGLTSGALFYKRFDQPAFAFNAGVYIRLPTPPGFRRATFFVGDTVQLRHTPYVGPMFRFSVLKTRVCSGPEHVVGCAPHAELLVRSHQTQREFWVCQDECVLLTFYASAAAAPVPAIASTAGAAAGSLGGT